jgi:hypothetical protein
MKKIFTLLATGINLDVITKNWIHNAHSLWQKYSWRLSTDTNSDMPTESVRIIAKYTRIISKSLP